ncbi:MAG: hypothetical protein AVDCRST_MAG87-3951, partial [uncultured Thermomicrobiales bacterium]
ALACGTGAAPCSPGPRGRRFPTRSRERRSPRASDSARELRRPRPDPSKQRLDVVRRFPARFDPPGDSGI